MAGRKPRQPPAGAGGEPRPPAAARGGKGSTPSTPRSGRSPGRPAAESDERSSGAAAGGRSAANSSKVQLLPAEGAQIHELWPDTGASAMGSDDIHASQEWEPAPEPEEGPAPEFTSKSKPTFKAKRRMGRGQAPIEPGTRTAPDSSSGASAVSSGGDRGLGTEASILAFPEPPVRRRRRYILAGTGVAAALLAALFAVLFFSPALELKTLQVQGNSLLSVEEAETALAPLLGTPLTLISDADAGELLAGRPEVEKVAIAAMPPSGLLVTITERVPVAVLQNGSEFLLIDEEGRQLKAVAERGSVALPLIDGGTDAVNSDVFSTVTAVLAALPQNVLAQLEHASAQTVDSVELKLTNGQTVFWGSAEANVAKAKALEALLLIPPTDPPVEVFDVSTPERPVTR